MEYLYDIGSSDLKELWESYLLEPVLGQDVMMGTKEDDWNGLLYLKDKSPIEVVLRDRLMTDAALGGPKPIKSEHSYSLLASSSPASPQATNDNTNSTPAILSSDSINGVMSNSINHLQEQRKTLPLIRSRIDDMEEECFPAISMSPSSSNADCLIARLATSIKAEVDMDDCLIIKKEPLSAPESPVPNSSPSLTGDERNASVHHHHNPHSKHNQLQHMPHTSDTEYEEEEEDEEEDEVEEAYGLMEFEEADQEALVESNDGERAEELPPTPPSSAHSDSEGTISTSCSPERYDSSPQQTSAVHHVQSLKGFLTPRLYVTNTPHSSRQPIHTPLISCQPKGSTGILHLTEEEKRTLLAEGYSIPNKLPLTKLEEKSLKKIRRKIKNKISAQESRRKKKEYVDNLERRLAATSSELICCKNRLSIIEQSNRELLKELKELRPLRIFMKKSF